MYKQKYFAAIFVTVVAFGFLGMLISHRGMLISQLACPAYSDSEMYQETRLHNITYTMSQMEPQVQPQALVPGRTDVLTVSPWLAPIIWEGTFQSKVIDNMYQPLNVTVATTVFAVGKYIRLLQAFLESAEKHYMIGYRVHYYVFTDQMDKVPPVALASGRSLIVLPFPTLNRWQDISLMRMEFIHKTIKSHIHKSADFIFCLDVDMVFDSHFGAETFGELVATIHPWFYYVPRHNFPYERRAASQAYVPKEEGDFYYGGALWGGHVDAVYRVTKVCETQAKIDKQNNIEAAWQEESHLNRYFIINKPTKLLSPEYLWDKAKIPPPPQFKVIRLATIIKSYAELRPN